MQIGRICSQDDLQKNALSTFFNPYRNWIILAETTQSTKNTPHVTLPEFDGLKELRSQKQQRRMDQWYASNHSTEMVLPLLRCFFGGTSVHFLFHVSTAILDFIYSPLFLEKTVQQIGKLQFFSASQALAKPWEAMAFAPLGPPSEWAKSSRDTKMAIRRWEPQARFQKPSVLGCLFFLKGDFYVRITILKVYVFISSLSVIIHCIHVKCLSPYCTLRSHMIRLVLFYLNSLIFSELLSLCFQVFKGCPCDCFDQEPKAVVLIIHGGCGWPETQDHHDESRYVWGGSWTSKLSLVGQVLDLCTSCFLGHPNNISCTL